METVNRHNVVHLGRVKDSHGRLFTVTVLRDKKSILFKPYRSRRKVLACTVAEAFAVAQGQLIMPFKGTQS